MITLHAFGNIFPAGVGKTKDLWVQWALEEMGLAYEVRGWDYNGGETHTEAFAAISPFGQLPVLEDDGVVLAESSVILLHLAETHGRLTPADAEGRAQVRQWSVAAVATVMPSLQMLNFINIGFLGDEAQAQGSKARDIIGGSAERWLDGLVRGLESRAWIAGEAFTVADILTAGALREARRSDPFKARPVLVDYYRRAIARPACRRAVELYAQRFGVAVADIDAGWA